MPLLFTFFSLVGWTQAQGANLRQFKEASLDVYMVLGIIPNQNTVIVEPDRVTSPNSSNWVWLILRTDDGTSGNLSDAAFSYGAGLPSAGQNVCHRLSGNGVGDTLFQSGFEDGMPLANGGVIPASWWRNVPVGSLDYQTDTNQVFGTIPEDVWVRCHVSFTTPEGITSAEFTFVL